MSRFLFFHGNIPSILQSFHLTYQTFQIITIYMITALHILLEISHVEIGNGILRMDNQIEVHTPKEIYHAASPSRQLHTIHHHDITDIAGNQSVVSTRMQELLACCNGSE